ncbi:hypothetical protein JAAARDRAFT_38850 [Jaapia argillacea MUCL 33604]|uniref:F-box domain-containing protein n=1 Tax=Jaapia argillacea MUCL 33604 TaxID=933084 RepID=A0A067PJ71_9AGAM|nr:hypothetical protein JAAARDRAFT_38850 [Jaapia argillacea MUCL 33604]
MALPAFRSPAFERSYKTPPIMISLHQLLCFIIRILQAIYSYTRFTHSLTSHISENPPMYRSSHRPAIQGPASLNTIPEELVERILALCVDSPQQPPSPSPSPYSSAPNPASHDQTAILLVSKRFLRIATPLFYNSLPLRSRHQSSLLCRTLSRNTVLGSFVRKVVVHNADAYGGLGDLLRICHLIEELDLNLDGGDMNGSDDQGTKKLCAAFPKMYRMKRLTLRKPSRTYLTHEKPKMVLEALADALPYWRDLEHLTLSFRLSATPSTERLSCALVKCPRLHTVRAVMPVVWNPCLAQISNNPSLKAVELLRDESSSGMVVGTSGGLFLKEAKKHERFWALVKKGTPTVRERANTVTTAPTEYQRRPPPTPLASSQSLGYFTPTQMQASPSGSGYPGRERRAMDPCDRSPASPSSSKSRAGMSLSEMAYMLPSPGSGPSARRGTR